MRTQNSIIQALFKHYSKNSSSKVSIYNSFPHHLITTLKSKEKRKPGAEKEKVICENVIHTYVLYKHLFTTVNCVCAKKLRVPLWATLDIIHSSRNISHRNGVVNSFVDGAVVVAVEHAT